MSGDPKESNPAADNGCFIDDLPPELLCQIFDQLDLLARKESMTVCHHWNEVLSTPRYLNTQFLQVTARIAQKTVTGECKPHPVVEMDAERFRDDFELFRRYVFEENVVKNLEELWLFGDEKWLVRLFTACGELNLPQLRKLKVGSPLGCLQEPILLVAPKLKSVEISSLLEGDYGDFLKQPLFDSIEELIVQLQSPHYASIVLDRHFEKLRRLKIVGFLSLIARNNFPRELSQLAHLELHLSELPKDVLQLTPNLHTLKLSAFEIDINSIRPLKGLKELSLKVLNPYFKSPVNTAIELPNLVKLSIDIELAPNFITKSLQMLDAEVNRILVSRTTMEEYFDRLRHQLQVATFYFSDFSSSPFIIDLICKLTNLKALSLNNALVRAAQLERLFAQVKLRRAEFSSCSTSRFDYGFYANSKDPYEFFNRLKAQFADCAFIVSRLL